jgi:hypothetical protein
MSDDPFANIPVLDESGQAVEASNPVPVTTYSIPKQVGGADEMYDPNTARGIGSSDNELTPGVVAVNPSRYAIGTIFKNPETNQVFIAGDKHGNKNPDLIDIYRPPSQYSAQSGQLNMVPIGQIPANQVPKTAAGVRDLLSAYGKVPEGESAYESLSKVGATSDPFANIPVLGEETTQQQAQPQDQGQDPFANIPVLSQPAPQATPQFQPPTATPPTEPPSEASKIRGALISPLGYIGQEGWNAIAGIQRSLGFSDAANKSAETAANSVQDWADLVGGVAPVPGSIAEKAGQIGGAAVSFPALVGTGMAGMGTILAQAFGGAKEDLYDKYKQQGLSDQEANQKSTTHAAISTIAALPAYWLGGKAAGAIADRVIAESTPKLVDAVSRFGFNTVANSVGSAITRGISAGLEGEDPVKAAKDLSLGGVFQDMLFAGHSVGEHFKEQAQKGNLDEDIKQASPDVLNVLSKSPVTADVATSELERRQENQPVVMNPSSNPQVNLKEQQIIDNADKQMSAPPPAEQPTTTIPAATLEELKQAKIDDLHLQQLEHDPESDEYKDIQAQIDALNQPTEVAPAPEEKPAEAPVAEEKPTDVLSNSIVHTVRNNEDIPNIINNGLRAGSNITINPTEPNQSFGGQTVTLVFDKPNVSFEAKGYNPNDGIVTERNPSKPKAALIDSEAINLLTSEPLNPQKINDELTDLYSQLDQERKSSSSDPTAKKNVYGRTAKESELERKIDEKNNQLQEALDYIDQNPEAKEKPGVSRDQAIAELTKYIPNDIPVYSYELSEKETPINLKLEQPTEEPTNAVQEPSATQTMLRPESTGEGEGMELPRMAEENPEVPAEEGAPKEEVAPKEEQLSQLELWADNTIKESRKRLNVGLDPEVLSAYAVKGAFKIARGVRDFTQWSKEMLSEFGEQIRPHLEDLWNRAKQIHDEQVKYAPQEPTEQETYAKRAYDALTKARNGTPPDEAAMSNALSKKFPGISSREISDLYATASGKPKPSAIVPKPIVSPEETPEKISIRTKDQEDQVRRGILTSVVPAGEGMSLTEIEERGQQNLANGADPYAALDKAKSGDLESLITAKAYYKALQKQKSDILKSKGPNSPEYKVISQKAQDYYERLREAGTTASTALSVFRGETDLSDAADIATEFTKDTGEEPTLSQHQKIAQLADNVDKTTKKADVATTQAKDSLDDALSDVEIKTPESIEEGRQQIVDLSDAQGAKQKSEIDRLNNELEQTKKDLDEVRQAQATGQDANALREYYEAKIKDLNDQLSSQQKFGKEVFEQARKIVDRWKAEAVEAEKELSKKLNQLGSAPDPTIVVPLGKIIRAWIGEFGVNKAEALAKVIERFGEKIRPHFEAAWNKAQELIKGEPGAEKTTRSARTTKAKEKLTPAEKVADNLRKRIDQYQKKIKDINEGKISSPKDVEKVTNDEIKGLEKELADKKQQLSDARLKAKQRDLFEKGKIGEKLNLEQVKTLWESAKKFYIDKGENDWDKMVNDLASDFGLTPKQVREGLASPKGSKKATDEMYRAQINRRAALNNARRWLDNEKAGVIGKLYGKLAERTFRLSILGHGTAFMGTHAPSVRYSHPILSAKNWLKGFGYSFKGKDGRIKNFQDNKDLIYRPTWRVAREAGLENNPFSHDNEAPIKENSQNIFGRALDAITGGRGFDALYHLRQDMFDKEWSDLSITQRTPEYAKILAERINNATGYNKGGRIMGGIVQSPVARALLFAPKLVYSRFQWLLSDPAKMLTTFAKIATGQKTTLAERMGATYEFTNKVKFLAGLTFALGVNQALLNLTGSNQSINFTDPKKYDWLAYKGFGYQLQTVGAMTRLARLMFQEIHDAFGNLTRFEKSKGDRMTLAADDFVRYLKSGLSPLTRDIAVAVTGKDYVGNTVPWSNEQPDRGRRKLTWGEILAQQFTPIPISEASTQKELLPAVVKAGTAILRGDRIETPQDLEEYKKSMESRQRKKTSKTIPIF